MMLVIRMMVGSLAAEFGSVRAEQSQGSVGGGGICDLRATPDHNFFVPETLD